MLFKSFPPVLKLNHMRRIIFTCLSLLAIHHAICQSNEVDRRSFFTDDRPIEVTLTTNIRDLVYNKKEPAFQKASIELRFPDSSAAIKEDIEVRPRGIFRKEHCNMASLMLNFKTPGSPRLSSLKKLKFVGGCGKTRTDEQNLIKEYLVYKMYNLFTEMSFKVRLMKVQYVDSRNKLKPYTQYAFVIEDVDDMAKRNGCLEKEGIAFNQEGTSRDHTTLVGIFQYMIANVDWSVPNYHNIKLLVPKKDTMALPYVVPYDFDFCGLVNTEYAAPPEKLNMQKVTDRLYRGFPRTMEEIQVVTNLFFKKKEQVLEVVNSCSFSETKVKKQMTDFIEEFYDQIGNKKYLQANFIENARKN